jgi:hypothetical protein
MAAIPIRTAVVDGVDMALAAAAAGDTAPVGAGYNLLVNNASGGSINVTLVVPGNLVTGDAFPDKVVAVAAGQLRAIPLLDVYADPSDGQARVNYSATASVTRAVLRAA